MTTAEAWAARLRTDPSDSAAYAALKAHYTTTGDVDGVAQVLATWAGSTGDDVGAAEAYVELAQLVLANRPDASEAEPYFQEALRRDPLAMDALEGLTKLWEAQAAYSKLIELLQEHLHAMGRANAPPALLAFVRFQLGELWSKRFQSPDEALHHYRKAADLDPTLTAACYEARQIYRARGELRAAADLLEREIASEGDVARRAGLLRELGELHRDAIDDLDSSIASFERARELAPDDAELAYELATVLSRRASTFDARTARDEQRKVAELLFSISGAVSVDEALRYLESALDHAPDHEPALSALEQLAERTNATQLLPARWVAYLASGASGNAAHARSVKLARAYLAQGQKDDALFCLEGIADAYRPAAELLAQLQGGKAAAKTPPPAPQAKTAPPPTRKPAPPPPTPAPVPAAPPTPIPEAAFEPTTQTEDADELAARVASMAPEPRVPNAPLEIIPGPAPVPSVELPTDSFESDDLDELLANDEKTHTGAAPEPPAATATPVAAEAPVSEPPPRPRTVPPPPPVEEGALDHLKRRAGALARERRMDEAAEAYLEVFDLDASDPDAFLFLDGHYRKTRANTERARLLLESSSDDALPPMTRLGRLREAATLYETRIKNVDGALVAWQRVQAIDETADDALRAVRRLLERAERWDELVVALEADLSRAESDDARSTLLRRLVVLHRDHRKDTRAMAGALERLLELRDDDRATRDALLTAYTELERWSDAAALLEQRIEETKVKTQKLSQLNQLAELYAQRAKDSDRAHAVYERILELAPSDLTAIENLIALDEQSGNTERLLRSLERRVAMQSGAQAAATLARMAGIADRMLDDTDRAADFWTRAIEGEPEQTEHVEALCTLYESRDRHDDLAELLRERLLTEKNEHLRIELYRRLARVLGEHLADADGAAEAYSRLLAMREDPEALRALEQHARAKDDAQALVDLIPRLLKLESELEGQRDLLLERAELLSSRLKRPADAIVDLERIVAVIDPREERAWQALARVSEEANSYDALCTVLEGRLSSSQDAAEQRACAQQLARIYLDRAHNVPRAIIALQRWAAAAPDEAEPHELLLPLLRKNRKSAELLVSLDALARLAPALPARVEHAITAAAVLADELKQPEEAAKRLSALVAEGHGAPVEPLIALSKKTGQLEPLFDLLERTSHIARLLELLAERAEQSNEPAVVAASYRRSAQVLVEYQSDEDAAANAYLKLLELEEDADALRFLHAYALRRDQPALLASVLGRLAALERDADERLDLVLLQAQTLRTRLDKPAEGVAALSRLHSDRPDAIEELIACCEAANDHATLASTLERALGSEHEPTARARIAQRIADLCEGVLNEPARALRALDVWAAAEPEDVVPLRRLRPLLTNTTRHGELLSVLDRLAALETQPTAQFEATIAAAHVAETDLKDVEGAFQRLSGLIDSAHPDVDAALEALAHRAHRIEDFHRLLEECQRYDSLAQALDKHVAATKDRAARVALFRRIGRLRGGPLDDIERAVAAFRALLAEQEDKEALELLRTYALGRDDIDAVCDCLRRLAALETEKEQKRDLLYELGHLLRARKRDPQGAVTVLREVVESIDPDFEPALDELVTACEETGDAATLALAVERLSQREPEPERRVEHARRLVPLLLAQGATDRAIAALQRWSEVAPRDPEPRTALLPLLAGKGRHTEQLVELDALSTLAVTPDARLDAIADAAELCMTKLQDGSGAFERLVRSSNETAGGHPRTEALLQTLAREHSMLEPLEQHLLAAHRYDEVAQLLRGAADRERDVAVRAELLRRCARVLAGPLTDEVAATEAFEELLRVREDEEALAHLCNAARNIDDPAKLEGLLDRLAALRTDATEKRDLWLERARLLADRLERPTEAVALLRRILSEIDDSHTEAIDELLIVAETQGDFDALAFGLERRLSLAKTPRSQAELAQRLADVCEDALRDTDRAVRALKKWIDAEPGLPAPLRRLRGLLKPSDAQELLVVLDRLAVSEPDPDARAEAQLSGARLAAETFKDSEGALRRLAPLVLSRNEDAERDAIALLEANRGPTPALSKALANLYVLRAQRAEQPADALPDWMRAARIYRNDTGELEESFEAMLRALACDLYDRTVLSEIEQLAVVLKAWDRLGRVYVRLVQNARTPAERLELYLRHADLLESHARDHAGALERILEVCKLEPSESALLRAEGLAERVGHHDALVWIEETLGRLAANDEGRARRWLKAARAADLGLKDRELALSYMERILALTEKLPGVADDLEQLARELDQKRPDLGKNDARLGLIRAHMELGRGSPEPLGPLLMLRASQLYKDELRDDAACFDALKEAATLFPDDVDLYDALEKAGIRLKRLDALEAHLTRVVQRTRDPEAKMALLERRGRLLAEHLDRAAKAADAYRELSVLKPNDAEIRQRLFACLRKAGRYQELLKLLRERVELGAELPDQQRERLALLRQIAGLWEHELRNKPNAIQTWQELLVLAPEDSAAQAELSRLQTRSTA